MSPTRQPARQGPDQPSRTPAETEAARPEPAPAGPVPHEPLPGPTDRTLTHRERIHWHFHREHQLIHPSHGVLRVFTAAGAWVVPPHRAVWVPAGIAHAHQAHGHTRMRTLSFPAKAAPLRTDRPTVLAVGPLLREVIVSLSDDTAAPGRTARQRRTLEQVAIDELRQADDLPLLLPAPADDRLRSVAALLHEDPADPRTLAELGAAVGASERTLSRLFRREMGMSFPQWRTQLRLHHSLILLAAGTTVTATATACGYTHTSAFIEAFRHAFGTTPGRHRQPALP
ncbi:AraC family transcriptional regulator [Actinacidiphila bryophytorum]|uniref:HTH-type transcriptional regulator RipA n=1 Tax=Actinacidiphila bryophytorum TaxID=1436133 RepID=A0A9W4ED80_9ACTN|nr:helix-turn-helix transcriptional regulator [Actinacidiphila bryophytorum]CAG7617354.1 Transcriptional regulator, AraC family [Actinacidiphila bryophytorum]